MRFDLDDRWLDCCGFIDWQKSFQGDVRQSDSSASTAIHEVLHCFPCIKQSHPLVVDHAAVLIPWILLVPRLKCKWSVNKVKIQIVEADSFHTRLESGFNALGPMIRVPQLCGNKNVFACN